MKELINPDIKLGHVGNIKYVSFPEKKTLQNWERAGKWIQICSM
jgi:hypothetical protein